MLYSSNLTGQIKLKLFGFCGYLMEAEWIKYVGTKPIAVLVCENRVFNGVSGIEWHLLPLYQQTIWLRQYVNLS